VSWRLDSGLDMDLKNLGFADAEKCIPYMWDIVGSLVRNRVWVPY
jgi:hypothetical protein